MSYEIVTKEREMGTMELKDFVLKRTYRISASSIIKLFKMR